MFLLYVIKRCVEYYSLRFELKKNIAQSLECQTQITFQHIKKPLWRSFHTFYVILGI